MPLSWCSFVFVVRYRSERPGVAQRQRSAAGAATARSEREPRARGAQPFSVCIEDGFAVSSHGFADGFAAVS